MTITRHPSKSTPTSILRSSGALYAGVYAGDVCVDAGDEQLRAAALAVVEVARLTRAVVRARIGQTAFMAMPSPWECGTVAVLAAVHDSPAARDAPRKIKRLF